MSSLPFLIDPAPNPASTLLNSAALRFLQLFACQRNYMIYSRLELEAVHCVCCQNHTNLELSGLEGVPRIT